MEYTLFHLLSFFKSSLESIAREPRSLQFTIGFVIPSIEYALCYIFSVKHNPINVNSEIGCNYSFLHTHKMLNVIA